MNVVIQSRPAKNLPRCLVLLLALALTGCMAWLRAYQVYLQLDDFEQHFVIENQLGFAINFKHPVMYDQDFIDLSGLHPSQRIPQALGETWHYRFVKVDSDWQPIAPELALVIELDFNRYQRLNRLTLPPLFLQMAPSVFLNASIRSLAGAEIDRQHKKIHAKATGFILDETSLPTATTIGHALGEPVQSLPMADGHYRLLYHFLLVTDQIKPGYEQRVQTEVKLTFNDQHQLIKMSGRFAGLKISLNYQNLLQSPGA
ncbi:MAG: hypothetical protein RQ715_10650 [Methylococcales bacterium]|nr:hypothetical protein [Methylococcales bacterium]